MVAVVLLMGGKARRFGGDKLWAPLLGKELWRWSLEAFLRHPGVSLLVIVGNEGWIGPEVEGAYRNLISSQGKTVLFAEPGSERWFSVFNGLKVLKGRLSDEDLVLIHDSARPAVRRELVDRMLEYLEAGWRAVVPGVELTSTIKEVERTSDGDVVRRTLERTRLREIQTPQGYRFGLIWEAYSKGIEQGVGFTDCAGFVERFFPQEKVLVCEGDRSNVKVTYPQDLALLEVLLRNA